MHLFGVCIVVMSGLVLTYGKLPLYKTNEILVSGLDNIYKTLPKRNADNVQLDDDPTSEASLKRKAALLANFVSVFNINLKVDDLDVNFDETFDLALEGLENQCNDTKNTDLAQNIAWNIDVIRMLTQQRIATVQVHCNADSPLTCTKEEDWKNELVCPEYKQNIYLHTFLLDSVPILVPVLSELEIMYKYLSVEDISRYLKSAKNRFKRPLLRAYRIADILTDEKYTCYPIPVLPTVTPMSPRSGMPVPIVPGSVSK